MAFPLRAARRLTIRLASMGLACLPLAAAAQQAPTYSIDFQGPSLGALDTLAGAPIDAGDVLTNGNGGGFPGRPTPAPIGVGIVVGGRAGAAGAVPGGLGIAANVNNQLEVDALSFGKDFGTQIVFSVDEFAEGVAGPAASDVSSEGATGNREASGDVFAYLGAPVFTPPGSTIGNILVLDGDGTAPSGGYGLGPVEPDVPGPGAPDTGDNLDGLDIDTQPGDFPGPVFFSLDSAFPDPLEPAANVGTAAANGVSGADVLVSTAGGVPSLAIPAAVLGLDLAGFDSDDLDALSYNDLNGDQLYTPGELVLFSVRRGSAVIGTPDSFFGVPIEEGDVLLPPGMVGAPPGSPPAIAVAAEALGLRTLRAGYLAADDLDAIDVRMVPSYSIDLQGPSIGAVDGFLATTVGEGDLLTLAFPPGYAGPNPANGSPIAPPGVCVGAGPGAVGSIAGGLGIAPGLAGFREVDALSYGADAGGPLSFSVDEFAVGLANPALLSPTVASEGAAPGANAEASADVFVYLGPPQPAAPGGMVPGNRAILDGDALAPSGEFGIGLAEPNPPSPGVLPDAGDNLDAMDLDTRNPSVAAGPVFFSLDSGFADPLEAAPVNSGTAAGSGFSGADVLVSAPGAPGPSLAASAASLGLDLAGFDTDDLDALAFDDANGDLVYTPGGPDQLWFSVRRGSAVIGRLDSRTGSAIEEGDVLAPPGIAGATPQIVIAAESLGLATLRSGAVVGFPDDLDALDGIPFPVPEPGVVAGATWGGVLVALLSRRRRRRRT